MYLDMEACKRLLAIETMKQNLTSGHNSLRPAIHQILTNKFYFFRPENSKQTSLLYNYEQLIKKLK